MASTCWTIKELLCQLLAGKTARPDIAGLRPRAGVPVPDRVRRCGHTRATSLAAAVERWWPEIEELSTKWCVVVWSPPSGALGAKQQVKQVYPSRQEMTFPTIG